MKRPGRFSIPLAREESNHSMRSNMKAATAASFKNPPSSSASLPAPGILKFQREDWALFRTREGLQQRSGVTANALARLALKELTDNALDAGGESVSGKLTQARGYFVDDDGPGIDGTPEEIAALFSISRPMVSTKLLRLPTRGALGNGLRVVAGTVLVSGAGSSLVVTTRERRIALRPERDGTTAVLRVTKVKHPIGTRVEIVFGPDLPGVDGNVLVWSHLALSIADRGTQYAGRSSPHWYGPATFHELLYASGERPVRDLIANLDGCTGGKAGDIVAEAKLGRAVCNAVTREQADALLLIAQRHARPVTAERLGALGPDVFGAADYAKAAGNCFVDGDGGLIPFVVEAWADRNSYTGDDLRGDDTLVVCVNRTPITGEVRIARRNRDLCVYGCGLSHELAKAPKGTGTFQISINITTPFMPITSDGKAPNLLAFYDPIATAVERIVKKSRCAGKGGTNQKNIVLSNLDDVVAEVSGGGEYRFNVRQIFYAMRPIVMREINEELKIENFTSIITDYEAEHGEIARMYREPRGTVYHPHSGETISLGDLMVEEYERPVWTFDKLVYVEKEGFSEALKANGWAERHDCALLSSKGFSTRAARDLIDKLAEHDEPIKVFCAEDADAAGGMIFQTLQEATKARGARKITIVNLGLEPWEAIAMGLEVETFARGKRARPVAEYVKRRTDRAPDGTTWEEWLQTHRVELNAMTTPQFIAWLERKMAEHADGGKLIPPEEVLLSDLDERIEDKTRDIVMRRILEESGFEDQVTAAVAAIERPQADDLTDGIEDLFRQRPEAQWRDHNRGRCKFENPGGRIRKLKTAKEF